MKTIEEIKKEKDYVCSQIRDLINNFHDDNPQATLKIDIEAHPMRTLDGELSRVVTIVSGEVIL